MFEALTDRLTDVFKRLRGRGKLSEKNISDALREVRMSLLEADVNFRVVKGFIESVKKRALGTEVMKSLTPGQQFVKIVNEELVKILGGQYADLDLTGSPPIPIMLVGLQGSGKTTTAAKLAVHISRRKGKHPYLVPADPYRPAAIEQLKKLGDQIGIPVHDTDPNKKPPEVCAEAIRNASLLGCDVVIMDTAGRLHIDEEMMNELVEIKKAVAPREILLVADSMSGQDAVNVAQSFDERLGITGIILTKLDGDARGGAALSITSITGKPIKFAGTGEKVDALEPFYPDRMASRILDMGDVLSLIEKAESLVEEEEAKRLEKRLRKQQFTLEDFRDQLRQLKKMGSLEQLIDFMPGASKLKAMRGLVVDEKELVRMEAVINSMTPYERRHPEVLNASRKRRIARGSGTSVQDINRLLKNYQMIKNMLQKMMGGKGKKSRVKGLPFPFG